MEPRGFISYSGAKLLICVQSTLFPPYKYHIHILAQAKWTLEDLYPIQEQSCSFMCCQHCFLPGNIIHILVHSKMPLFLLAVGNISFPLSNNHILTHVEWTFEDSFPILEQSCSL